MALLLISGSFVLGSEASESEAQHRYLEGIPEAGIVPPPSITREIRHEFSHFIMTRDGIRLSTDLYFPADIEEDLPAILIRTPYDKRGWRRGTAGYLQTQVLVNAGYAVAVQDVRGKFESEGKYAPMWKDDVDEYDTVDWIIAQPWSNGNVGRYGCSYLGDNQVMGAVLRHPAVKALIPQSSGSAVGRIDNRFRYFGIKNGGVNELIMSVGWFRSEGSKIYYRPPHRMERKEFLEIADLFDPAPRVPEANTWKLAEHLPTVEIMEIAGVAPTDYEELFSHEPTDSWWDQFPYLDEGDKIDTPALFVNGWYDFGVAETLVEFNYFQKNAVSEKAADNQFAIISPMTHCAAQRSITESTRVGDRLVGDPRYNYWKLYIDWFDHWLKGKDNGVTDLPRFQYFVIGRNEWRGADKFPLPETEWKHFYLHSDGEANESTTGGVLSFQVPDDEPPDVFIYDPLDPMPSRGGPLCCTGADEPVAGSFDQSDIQERTDVLVYTSEPFEQGLEVTGPLKVVLYVSSDAKDTDFTARISDVYPDGQAFNVQEGILRARYRDGFDKTVWMEDGRVYRLEVDLEATSNYFKPHHRLRLDISSSSWPRWERNLNTGGAVEKERREDAITARNSVHHSGNHASYVLLPVTPGDPGENQPPKSD